MTDARQMIDALQAPDVVWGLATTGEPVELHPLEAQAIAKAVPKRRAEFMAGRLAARRAFEAAGIPPAPIPMAEDRSPTWPEGLAGSITHSGSLAICAITQAPLALGIDLEAHAPLPPEMAHLVCHPGDDGAPIEVFSAKEAAYKALYPHCRVIFGFDGMRISGGSARIVETLDTACIPVQLRRQSWPVQQSCSGGRILSLCLTQM